MNVLDRLLGHDTWTTRQLLLRCTDLSDEQLDHEFDIGQEAAPWVMHEVPWKFAHDKGLALLIFRKGCQVLIRAAFLRKVAGEVSRHAVEGSQFTSKAELLEAVVCESGVDRVFAEMWTVEDAELYRTIVKTLWRDQAAGDDDLLRLRLDPPPSSCWAAHTT